MEARDLKRKEETENAKARLNDIKQFISETSYKITKMECDHKEAKSEHNKKLKNLQTTEATQQFTICKLNSDLKSSEQVLQTRLQEEHDLLRTNAELKQEIKKVKEENKKMASDFHNKLQELEEQINRGYAQLQSEKDAEALMELGVDSLKAEDQVFLLKEVLSKNEATDRDGKSANAI